MIDITNPHCPAMPQRSCITRDLGQWCLHQECPDGSVYAEEEYYLATVEITHCPWCGKEL